MKGNRSSLFYCTALKKELVQLIEESINKDTYFIIGVNIVQLKGNSLIKVVVDSDKGITIDECSTISRELNQRIEESKIVENYELEVTSPGVGEPIKLARQYFKNIGRRIQVVDAEGVKIEGKLTNVVLDDFIEVLEEKKNKHKIVDTQLRKVSLNQIKKAVILVSFN
ncbi:MAG: hypothetical protein SFY32_07555 [Bacteroidota bacterium]|nr:hypothetical protein [Bacteroidota bacterium]